MTALIPYGFARRHGVVVQGGECLHRASAGVEALIEVQRGAALQSLGIGAVTIEVAVDGLTGVKFATPSGSFDGSQNFAAFGLPPVVGAGLDISAPELFVKPVDTLSVAIRWAGLPITSTGFKGYYQDYILNADGDVAGGPLFDNRSFRARFSVVNPGPWQVDTTAASFLTLWPTGTAAPITSTLNWEGGEILANGAALALGPAGSVEVRTHAGSVHVVLDVTGWFG